MSGEKKSAHDALRMCRDVLALAVGEAVFASDPRFRAALDAAQDALVAPILMQPLGRVEWVRPEALRSNHYNPNRVFSIEMDLLKVSIMEDGWTQPIVARPDGEIIDGFHRWTLGSKDPDIRAMTGGLVPVVRVAPRAEADQMLATIRHNRARGKHGILHMAAIVRQLLASGLTKEELQARLGMEPEEVERLADMRPAPARLGRESYGKGWVPDRVEAE